MTFIVFLLTVKSLGIEEVKECKDLKVKIPNILGDIQLMVKNQKYCRCSSKRTTEFTTITQNILPESPSKLMSGGGDSAPKEDKNKMLDKEMVEVIKNSF